MVGHGDGPCAGGQGPGVQETRAPPGLRGLRVPCAHSESHDDTSTVGHKQMLMNKEGREREADQAGKSSGGGTAALGDSETTIPEDLGKLSPFPRPPETGWGPKWTRNTCCTVYQCAPSEISADLRVTPDGI